MVKMIMKSRSSQRRSIRVYSNVTYSVLAVVASAYPGELYDTHFSSLQDPSIWGISQCVPFTLIHYHRLIPITK